MTLAMRVLIDHIDCKLSWHVLAWQPLVFHTSTLLLKFGFWTWVSLSEMTPASQDLAENCWKYKNQWVVLICHWKEKLNSGDRIHNQFLFSVLPWAVWFGYTDLGLFLFAHVFLVTCALLLIFSDLFTLILELKYFVVVVACVLVCMWACKTCSIYDCSQWSHGIIAVCCPVCRALVSLSCLACISPLFRYRGDLLAVSCAGAIIGKVSGSGAECFSNTWYIGARFFFAKYGCMGVYRKVPACPEKRQCLWLPFWHTMWLLIGW